MLSLSKKTDYALIALAYLAAQPDRTASAREIAEARNLPPALLMNILKELHQHGMLHSTRGAKGGYQLGIDLHRTSLHELVVALEGPVRLVECAQADPACQQEAERDTCRVSGTCTVQAPLQALHRRLVRFLSDVKLSDIVLPGTMPIEITVARETSRSPEPV
jgi:Rrf2 family protein